jgi:ABC-type multidrug transport system ATPase subunit
VAALPPREYVERHGAAYLAELPALPPRWTVESTLARGAPRAGVPAGARRGRIELMLESLGLAEQRSRQVRQLSKGNLQRLGLAQALLTEERVVVLDEPTHGLDPVWTQRFRDVVASLRREDRTILIASHNLDELARLADRVAIIDHGRLQRVVEVRGTAEPAVGERAPYRVVMARGAERLPAVFPTARALGQSEFQLDGLTLDEVNAGLAALLANGALVSMVYPVHSMLEQQFRDAVGVGEGAS